MTQNFLLLLFQQLTVNFSANRCINNCLLTSANLYISTHIIPESGFIFLNLLILNFINNLFNEVNYYYKIRRTNEVITDREGTYLLNIRIRLPQIYILYTNVSNTACLPENCYYKKQIEQDLSLILT